MSTAIEQLGSNLSFSLCSGFKKPLASKVSFFSVALKDSAGASPQHCPRRLIELII